MSVSAFRRRCTVLAHVWPGTYDGWWVATAYVGLFDLLIMASWRRRPGVLAVVWSISTRRWEFGPKSWMVRR